MCCNIRPARTVMSHTVLSVNGYADPRGSWWPHLFMFPAWNVLLFFSALSFGGQCHTVQNAQHSSNIQIISQCASPLIGVFTGWTASPLCSWFCPITSINVIRSLTLVKAPQSIVSQATLGKTWNLVFPVAHNPILLSVLPDCVPHGDVQHGGVLYLPSSLLGNWILIFPTQSLKVTEWCVFWRQANDFYCACFSLLSSRRVNPWRTGNISI